MLRIGCVKYLIARPLIYGWSGAVDFDDPAALCRKLELGISMLRWSPAWKFATADLPNR